MSEDHLSGPEAAAYYDKLRKDRAASLPVREALAFIEGVAATGASLRRLMDAAGPTAREPAAPGPSGPRNAAAEAPEAPATSPLAARVLGALMQMPDAEFLAMANKVLNRYYAAVAALAPDGQAVQIECLHCGKAQTHRVCADCFPKDYDG